MLSLIAEGLSNQEIARTLHVSTATVKTHINNLFAKAGLKDRAQAVRYAYGKGLVRPPRGESPDGVKTAEKKSRGSSRSVHPWACSQQRSSPRRREWSESPAENHEGHDLTRAEAAGRCGTDDPWYDALASGWGETDGTGGARARVPAARREDADARVRAADIYLEVQRSAAFQEVRRRYRRFVVPATVVFLTWYLAYVVAATTAPDLMARPVAGALNVAMVAGLGQFLTTFLLTWAYARHARLHRDRAALDLRWETQELTTRQSGAR